VTERRSTVSPRSSPAPCTRSLPTWPISARLGPVSVLVNNAGHGHWDPVVGSDEGAFRSAIEVNYLATVNATLHVLPGMLRRGRGHIVNIVSIAGRIGSPFEAAYSASKFATVGFSEALAAEISGAGVAVSMIHPGPVATGFADARRRPPPRGAPRPVPVESVVDAVLATVRQGDRPGGVSSRDGTLVRRRACRTASALGRRRLDKHRSPGASLRT
jgi:short-subunit dehydrogenase